MIVLCYIVYIECCKFYRGNGVCTNHVTSDGRGGLLKYRHYLIPQILSTWFVHSPFRNFKIVRESSCSILGAKGLILIRKLLYGNLTQTITAIYQNWMCALNGSFVIIIYFFKKNSYQNKLHFIKFKLLLLCPLWLSELQ